MPSKVSEAGSGTGCNIPSKLNCPYPPAVTVTISVNEYGVVEMFAAAMSERENGEPLAGNVPIGIPVPKGVSVKSTKLCNFAEDPGAFQLPVKMVDHCVGPAGESRPVSVSSIVNVPAIDDETFDEVRSIDGIVVDVPPIMFALNVPTVPV